MSRVAPPRHSTRARLTLLVAMLVSGVLVAGCAGRAAETDTAAGNGGSGDPVTVVNCGTEVRFDSPPERVVTIKSTTTELMLALGLGDRIVATAFQDGPVPERWTDDVADVRVLSDQAPSQEVVLEQEPDLVFAGWESNLAADTAGERDTWARLGVSTYVAPSACQSADQPDKMTFDLLFAHFDELGRIFGVPERSAALVARQRAQLARVPQADEGTTALWWSSGNDTPYVGAGIGAPQMVMEAVGLTNVAQDVSETWTSLGWEAIVAADPDVLVLVDATWNPAKAKIEMLENNPATAGLTAVRHKRYVFVPFPAAEAGVRSVQAATDIAAQLADFGLVAAPDPDRG